MYSIIDKHFTYVAYISAGISSSSLAFLMTSMAHWMGYQEMSCRPNRTATLKRQPCFWEDRRNNFEYIFLCETFSLKQAYNIRQKKIIILKNLIFIVHTYYLFFVKTFFLSCVPICYKRKVSCNTHIIFFLSRKCILVVMCTSRFFWFSMPFLSNNHFGY